MVGPVRLVHEAKGEAHRHSERQRHSEREREKERESKGERQTDTNTHRKLHTL